MTDSDLPTGQEVAAPRVVSPKVSLKTKTTKARKEIQARCVAAGLKFEDAIRFDKPVLRVGLRCSRHLHWVYLEKPEQIIRFSSIDFEKWVFLQITKPFVLTRKDSLKRCFASRPPRRTRCATSDGCLRQRGASPSSMGSQFNQTCA